MIRSVLIVLLFTACSYSPKCKLEVQHVDLTGGLLVTYYHNFQCSCDDEKDGTITICKIEKVERLL